MTSKEKTRWKANHSVFKTTQLFFTGLDGNSYNYWRKRILDKIVRGKDVITLQKINSIDILNSKPENGTFSLEMNYSVL